MSLRQLATPETNSPALKQGLNDSFEFSDEEKPKVQPADVSTSSTANTAPTLARRASSRRWYSDSEDECEVNNNQSNSVTSLHTNPTTSTLNRRASASAISARSEQSQEKAVQPPALNLKQSDTTRQRPASGFQKLVQKSKVLSPFRSNKKVPTQQLEAPATPTNEPASKSQVETVQSIQPIQTTSRRQSSRMLVRASSETLAPTPEDEPDDAFQMNAFDALSPGRGALGGATAGVSGSGVLLEGWLRQKQRRGIRGLKAWNSRYFVLYAKSNEMRYFSDVVQSGWGPIPLGELGCISLRSIQRISKPSHPKYKGCRFDITCRMSASYDENVLSSDDEQAKKSKSTPKATREYCLVSDSPHTTVTWVNMLDSLLTRSVNSPRPDTLSRGGSSAGGTLKVLMQQNMRHKSQGSIPPMTSSTRSVVSNPSTSESVSVFSLPDDIVPKAIVLAIEYIFESFPGIETKNFYEQDSPPERLKTVVRFLNQCAIEQRKPTRNDWEDTLDVVSAAGVVKLWLKQLDGPIIPRPMHTDFKRVMTEGAYAPFDLRRNLKDLLASLPPRHFKMMAYLIFHWNDVTVYASKNMLSAGVLAGIFVGYVFKPEGIDDSIRQQEVEQYQSIVEYMITHADALIDETEAELLD